MGLRDFTFDFGCVNVDDPATIAIETCEDMGLEPSPGNNRIFDNAPFFGGVDVLMFSAFTAAAQGNWWGDPAGLGECVELPPGTPFTIDPRCFLAESAVGQGFGTFDARFHLTEDPRP